MEIQSNEMVNHPNHYGGENNPYEVIKVCEAWDLDKDAYLFNVVKYVARAGKKCVTKERMLRVYINVNKNSLL